MKILCPLLYYIIIKLKIEKVHEKFKEYKYLLLKI